MRKPALTPALLREALMSRMPAITRVTVLAGGEESQAFRFCSDGRPYVARVNRNVEGFQKDDLAHRMFRCPRLPIPAVVCIDRVDNFYYCVSEEAPGVTLQTLDAEELPHLLVATADVLEAIAASDIACLRGFGAFDSQGNGTDNSWRSFLTAVLDPQRYDWKGLGRVVDPDRIGRLCERLEHQVVYCPETRGLIHGDFGSNNVLTRNRRITGIIDWSEAAVGDPLYDIANIFFWRTWLACMQQQACYFESHPSCTLHRNSRLLCYQLRIGLAEIYQHALNGNPGVVEWATFRSCQLIA